MDNFTAAAPPSQTGSGNLPFVPATGLRGGHRQTLLGALRTGSRFFSHTIPHTVRVSDGDDVLLHDDRPKTWKRGGRTVLMLHGLSGCHRSGYMMRIAGKLNNLGVRTFRMDHRGCGAGRGLAKHPYHAGRVDDLDRAIRSIRHLCQGSLVSVVGFSLSGNLLLRYLGDRTFESSVNLFRAIAVCPPVDLKHCVLQLEKTKTGQFYDWYFTRRLARQIASGPLWRSDLPLARVKQLPQRLYDFDTLYTAPASGFDSADAYYRFASASPYLKTIIVPTTILAAEDDPLVSAVPLGDLALPRTVLLRLTKHGGHLGYISCRTDDPDRHWMDWRIIDWLLN